MVVRRYGPDTFEETVLRAPADLAPEARAGCTTWVDVTGLADTSAIAELGRAFGLHALSLEDVFDVRQRPKLEHYGDHLFIVLQTLSRADTVEAHPISLFVGEDFVLTLAHVDNPAVRPVRERLVNGHGQLRTRGADYLAYALIDTIVDHYFPVMEAVDDDLETTEEAVLEAHDLDPIAVSQRSRQDLQTIRHAVWPARDVIKAFMQSDLEWIRPETQVHLRDCHDHIAQLHDMLETSREIAASLLEAYLSRVTLRTNEVMQMLTIIATIFLPLTFVSSLYGMNFDRQRSPYNMPELGWYLGYPFSLLLMVLTATAFLVYFWKKGWFGARARGRSQTRPPARPPG